MILNGKITLLLSSLFLITYILNKFSMNSTMNFKINSIEFSINKFAVNITEFNRNGVSILKAAHMISSTSENDIRVYKISAISLIFQYMLNNQQFIYTNTSLAKIIINRLENFLDGDEPWFGAIIYAERLFPGVLKHCKNYQAAFDQHKRIINNRRGIK